MDIETLGLDYKGKVTFWGEIDRQHILPFGTPEEVREAVYRVRKALGDDNGGVIAQCEWGKFDPIENIHGAVHLSKMTFVMSGCEIIHFYREEFESFEHARRLFRCAAGKPFPGNGGSVAD
jgi:hypothetical protein